MKFTTSFFITLFCVFTVSAQVLTIQQGGATGTSGTGWSITGTNPVTLTVTSNATVAPSVLSAYLTGGAELEIWTGSVVFNTDFSFSNASLTLRLSGVSVSGTGNLGLGANAVLALSSGTTVSNAIDFTGNGKIQFAPLDFEYLVVGGGGGGGNGYDAGGGGGGGGGMVITGYSSLLPGSNEIVIVGSGGVGGENIRSNRNGSQGVNSSFGSLVAIGGGYGGGSRTANFGPAGSGVRLGGTKQDLILTIPASGGNGGGGGGAGGGGGGAGAAGTNGSGSATAGVGGSGLSSSISGTPASYGRGGNGGNANVSTIAGVAGGVNTGNGGGAGSARSSASAGGGAGGSGIVVVRYRGTAVNSAGTVSSITVSGVGYTVHQFTTGTSAFAVTEGVLTFTGNLSGTGSPIWNATGGIFTVTGSYGVTGSTTIEGGTLTVKQDQPTFGNPNFIGPGKLEVESSGPSFTGTLSTANWTFNSNLTGLRLGKQGNSSGVNLHAQANLNGPLVVHGGTLSLNQAHTSSGPTEFHGTQLFVDNTIKTTGSASLLLNVQNTRVAHGKFVESAGDLTNNGELLLQGENTSDGGYAQLKFGGNYFAGQGAKIVQQQYLESGHHLMSSPFSGVTGEYFGSANTAVGGVGETGHSAGNTNLWWWNGADWTAVLNNASSIVNGQGYSGLVSSSGFRKYAGLHSFEGSTPNKQVTFNLNYSEANQPISVYNENTLGRWGWNLVANPFTCALDYSSVTKPGNNSMNGAVYRWKGSLNNGQGGYEEHSPAGPPQDLHIAPLQAFWVQTRNNLPPGSTLVMNMAAHGDPSQSPVFRKSFDLEADRYGLVVESTSGTQLADQCYVALTDLGTDGFDSDWDALKLYDGPGSIALYNKVNEDVALANNAVTYSENDGRPKILNLVFDPTTNSGSFALRLDGTYSTGNQSVFIEDPSSGQFQRLNEQAFHFYAVSGEVKSFNVHFRNAKTQSLLANQEEMVSTWVHGQELSFWSELNGSADWVLTALDGRECAFGKVDLELGRVSRVALKSPVVPGIYVVRLRFENGAVQFKKISCAPIVN